MSGGVLDRVVFNQYERPVSEDWNRVQAALLRAHAWEGRFVGGARTPSIPTVSTTRRTGRTLRSDRTAAFHDDGLLALPRPSSLTVDIQPGLGWLLATGDVPSTVPSAPAGVGDEDPFKPVLLRASKSFTVPAPSANPRIDLLEVKYQRELTDAVEVQILDPSTGVLGPVTLPKTLAVALDGVTPTFNGSGLLNVKHGAESVSPTAPTVTTGYAALATFLVSNSTSTITEVRDHRLIVPRGTNGLRVTATFLVNTAAWTFADARFHAPPGVLVDAVLTTLTTRKTLQVLVECGANLDAASMAPGVHVTVGYPAAMASDAQRQTILTSTHGWAVAGSGTFLNQNQLLVDVVPWAWNYTGLNFVQADLPSTVRITITIDLPTA